MHNKISILIISLFMFAGCRNSGGPITKISDYERYMVIASADSMHSLQRINADIDFWLLRLETDPGDAVAKTSLAGLHSARFKTAGDINDIHTSDSLFQLANSLFKTNSSSAYRALAANCITQHKFQQAQLYLDTALHMGDDLYLTLLMRFDVAMELGNLYVAEQTLKRIGHKNSFDYFIREAKVLDHKGDLEGATKKMEAATQKAIESKKDALYLWAKSNLADMYGHANKYKASYQCYLEVLQKRPDYLYALKGIAWLAFSHDKNTKESKRILNYLSGLHPVPDYELLLAEIAAYEEDEITEDSLLRSFIIKVSDSRYTDMYNKYVFYLMIDENKIEKALQIAEREVKNRPTSQSYDLLAWAYYNMGRKEEALKVAKTYVENRNYEPDALYHMGVHYADAGNFKKAKHFLKQAKSSAFELGPALTDRVREALKGIKN